MKMDFKYGLLHISCLVLIFCTQLIKVLEAVKISHLQVPRSVAWGSSVLLDCEYDFRPEEKKGLVIKWFKDGHRVPVYQWIPRRKPQAYGILRNKVQENYKVTSSDEDDDDYEKYRAIFIKKVTGELAGTYTCQVSSFDGEDSKSAKLTVFAKPEYLEININEKEDNINVTCEAEDVFPMPVLQLKVYDGSDDDTPEVYELNEKAVTSSEEDDNDAVELFRDIAGYKVFDEDDLPKHTVFECALSIPNTDISMTQRAEYYPGDEDDSDENSAISVSNTLIVLIVTFIGHLSYTRLL